MKLTDEQYEQVGKDVVAKWQETGYMQPAYAAAGRAAVAAVAPILLAEPTMREIVTMNGSGPLERVGSVFANRLASLTAKPDPAVEAVKNRLKDGLPTAFTEWIDAHAAGIVADIDKARGEAELNALPRARVK